MTPAAALGPPTVVLGAVCLQLEVAEGGQERRFGELIHVPNPQGTPY